MLTTCKLIIKNDYSYLEPVSSFLESIVRSIGFSAKEIFRIKYALEETLTNIIETSFDEDEIADIEIEFKRISSGIELIVHDKGMPFNPFRQIETEDKKISFESTRQDISEQLIHKMIDSAIFRNLGKNGKEVQLKLFSDNFRINNLPEKEQETKPETLTDDSYEKVRLFVENDAYEVSKLFYKSYGYSYVNEAVYFPERILHNVKIGKMHSVIAVSKKEKIIGHVAIFEPDTTRLITEWGMAVSDPTYRGQGIMNYNVEFILNHAQDLGYKGIYAHSVTNHAFTQKVCSKYNFITCALFVGYAPDLSFKKINSVLSQRESTFIDFKYYAKPEKAELFLPVKYKNIIEEIYQSFEIEIRNSTNYNNIEINPEQKITEEIVSALNSVNIYAYNLTPNSIDDIKKLTKNYCLKKIDNIFLFLNLENSFSMQQTNAIEEIGYVFVGIFPMYVFNHTIVFQYINNTIYDFEKIVSYSPLASKIKATIKKELESKM